MEHGHGDTFRWLAACERDIKRRMLDVCPRVRLVGVFGMGH